MRQSLARSFAGALFAAVCAGTVALPAIAVRADVPLSCPYGDDRTKSDKLPRQGVVVTTYYPYVGYQWNAYTITNDGHLDPLYPNGVNGDQPLVAAWQNGTDCYGFEISRNAWAVGPTGRVYGEADFSGPPAYNYGDMYGRHLNRPILGMSPTSTGRGYWLVASDGGIFTFGDGHFYGSMGGVRLAKPITGMTVTPTGHGYWMVANDGGVFTFGDGHFYGSMGGVRLWKPITGMTATTTGHGYWMVASDGGVFCFGDAKFHGSTGGRVLNAPIAGMIPHGSGYTLIGQDGTLYPFS